MMEKLCRFILQSEIGICLADLITGFQKIKLSGQKTGQIGRLNECKRRK